LVLLCVESHSRSPFCPRWGGYGCWRDHPIPLGVQGGGLDEYQRHAADGA
jgi:hypothetical protein